MCLFNIVLYLRNKYLNLKPSESLSTEVGKDGKLCVCVDAALPPAILTIIWACMMIPAMLETFKEVSPLRWCRMPGTGWRSLCFRVAVFISCLLLLQEDSRRAWVETETPCLSVMKPPWFCFSFGLYGNWTLIQM